VRAVVGLRRWRHNPLRRKTDLVEAWVAFAAALLQLLAVPALGWICGALTDDSIQRTVRAQHAELHRTPAVVVVRANTPARDTADTESTTERDKGNPVIAKWTAADGSRHTEIVPSAPPTARAGDTIHVWTDGLGQLAKTPMDLTTAHTHAALAGFGAAAVATALIESGRGLIVWRLTRQRYARLDVAWAQAGPDWGRTGAGS